MDGIAARGVVVRRDMDAGAIAGTVVGVVVAVALLAFCLYPVIVHYLRRRRHADNAPFDPEAAIAEYQARPPGADLGSHRRLSSSDSYKHDGDLSRGDIIAPRGKEYGWNSHNGTVGHAEDGRGPLRQMPSTGPDAAASNRSLAAAQSPSDEYELQSSPSQLPFYMGEYMPESDVHDDTPGVLKGTSADYYSPSIPSEAFGMIATPPDLHIETGRSGSRSSSLKYNVRHMFRRKSGRDNTLDSYIVTSASDVDSASAGAVELHGATVLRQMVTNEDPTESPTEVSPTMVLPAALASPALRLNGSPTNFPSASPPPSSAMITPQPQIAERSSKHSPSPPAYPAPGTVNPMDIMPATTEAEVWHRTEHQLFVLPFDSSEGVRAPPELCQPAEYTSIITSPSPTTSALPQTTQHTQSLAPIELREDVKQEHAEDDDIAMADAHAYDRLDPSAIPRHPSYPSDQSTPFPGPGSTDPSSHNTPSTQLDSPTPESTHSSDFRHSASPQPGLPSPRNGLFRCSEPGCNQVFDQPHKLKHHQRYHKKDHKCPYPNCGKGFGTKTHLQRHINDRHEKKKKFHCSVPDCDYSRAGGKGFPRKDNWKRHMTKIHNMDQTQLPEPVEVDHEMSGT